MRYWYGTSVLERLPEYIPGFPEALAGYARRDLLIRFVWLILDALPWSLTAQERAVQLVRALTPIIEGATP
jgi:hypothetical protein